MFKQLLKNKIISSLLSINEKDIYAVSFLIEFSDDSHLPLLTVFYNTEEYCETKLIISEERWNIAYWQDNYFSILDGEQEINRSILHWYKNIGVNRVGYENEDEMYDEDMNYIGRGPNGFWEIASLLVDIAKEIHSEETFFKKIPIIINDYEYSWYTYNFTESANPDGQANCFLESYKKFFI